jgi:hypothetical protein
MNLTNHPIVHGQGRRGKQTREFRSYHDAKKRCTNKKTAGYKNYGGRGIKFLFSSFQQFFSELGPCPPGKTLDRKNNDGHYELGNVRWATRHEQNSNQRYRPDRRERMLGNKIWVGRKHTKATKRKMAKAARRRWNENRHSK